MQIQGLDGRYYRLDLGSYLTHKSDDRKRSSYHREARSLLRELFPVEQILEEVLIPGLPTLSYADFYLPRPRLMVEVQGEQHDDPDHFFHKDRAGYLKARHRDQNKVRWCQINRIFLACLVAGENLHEWRQRILSAFVSEDQGAGSTERD